MLEQKYTALKIHMTNILAKLMAQVDLAIALAQQLLVENKPEDI